VTTSLCDRRMQTLKFRRQAPIGPYIVDFLCIAHRLIVEADGSQHAESKRDAIRDQWLAQEGYTILRFSNRDVLTARESVLATIAAMRGLPW
jgi:very-short-patch-repair endonuclease